MTIDTLKENLKKIPTSAGIYIFQDTKNKPLYIGKALNLKNRLKSYLKTDDPRIQKMIATAEKIKHVQTNSDIEALILESQYIKKYQPPFNIMLRDDKQYFYVGFTKNKLPRIYLTHQPVGNDEYIGPFTDGSAIKTTLRFLRSIFPYCTCKQLHHNRCLNYHIGKCLGFCCLKSQATKKGVVTYLSNIKSIRAILNGGKNSLIKKLKKNADTNAKADNFKKAIELRNKIEKLERVFKNARIIRSSKMMMPHNSGLESLLKQQKPIIRIEGYDVSNIQGTHATGSMVTFVNGQPDKNFYRKFKIHNKQTPDDTAMLKEILERRFKHTEWPFPDLILIDGGKGQVNVARSTLATLKITIPIIGISKDDRHIGHQIFIPNRKSTGWRIVALTKLSPTDKNLLLAIDGEAHRFAISYYRKLHRKKALWPL